MDLKHIKLIALFFILALNTYGARVWYQKAAIGGDARHRTTGFAIGNKGYIGGGHINSGTTITYKDYWEYDPSTNSWTQIADFGGGLRYHSSAFTIGSYAYVGCGENATHEYKNDFWKYVPEVNTWFRVADFPGTPRRGGTAFTIDGKGYFGCGQSDGGYEGDFYCYDPLTNEWTEISEFIGEPRNAAVSFSYAGKGYLGTGHMVGAALNDFYEYNPATDEWVAKANVGPQIRQDAVGFCIDGKGYIGTGNDNLGNDFKDIWEYDFSTDTWTQIDDFSGEKRRYAVTFIINNTVYLGSGTDGTNFKDFWAYSHTASVDEEQIGTIELSIYPNPSSDIITFDLTNISSNELYYLITDETGKHILKDRVEQTKYTIFKEDVGSGTFFVSLLKNGTSYLNRKFIFI